MVAGTEAGHLAAAAPTVIDLTRVIKQGSAVDGRGGGRLRRTSPYAAPEATGGKTMSKSYLAAALTAGVLLSVATGAAAAEAAGAKGGKAASIEGVWKVSNVVITGANPITVTSPQPSLYIFDRGYFALVQVTGDKPRTATPAFKDPAKPTDAEKLARYEEYAPFGAQAGTYVLKGGKLTRTATVAKAQVAMSGTPYDVDATLSANTLVLTGHAAAGQPARETKITLTRVK